MAASDTLDPHTMRVADERFHVDGIRGEYRATRFSERDADRIDGEASSINSYGRR